MKKILISENQYKRLFLLEQYEEVDIKDISTVEPDYKKYPGTGYPQGPDLSQYDKYKQQEFSNLMKDLSFNGYEEAQRQWKKWGAPNTVTGLKKVDVEIVQALKEYAETEMAKFDRAEFPPETMDHTGAGGAGVEAMRRSTIDAQNFYDSKHHEVWAVYHKANKWNSLIDNQKTLIPQYCVRNGKIPGKYWWVDADSDEAKEYKKKKGHSGFNVGYGWVDSDGSINRNKRMFRGKDVRKNLYKVWRTNTYNNYSFCDNADHEGPFVYDLNASAGEDSRGYGKKNYACLCITGNDVQYLNKFGEGATAVEILNIPYIQSEFKKEHAAGFWEGLGDWVSTCTDDYHCWLDIASIAALAIPGWGILIAAGIDLANATAYSLEAMNMEPGLERDLHWAAAGLTALSAVPGVGKAARIYKGGSKVTQRLIKDITFDYTKLAARGTPTDKAMKEIFEKHMKTKGVNSQIKKQIANYFDAIKTATPESKVFLSKMDEFTKLHKVDFENFLKNPPAKFTALLKKADDNMAVAFHAYKKTAGFAEAKRQFKWFVALYAALPPVVGKTIEKYTELVKDGTVEKMTGGKYGGTRAQVEAAGYPWIETKEYFGACNTKKTADNPNPCSQDQSSADNVELGKAWRSGWRPWDEGVEDVGPGDINPVPEKFWTPTYIERENLRIKEEEENRVERNRAIDSFIDDDFVPGGSKDLTKTDFTLPDEL